MRIAVVSDTHGRVENARRAARLLEGFAPSALLHCGDIGSPQIVAEFPWPSHYVFGNVDHDEQALRATIEAAGHVCHGQFGRLELAGIKIGLLHGHDLPLLQKALSGGAYGLLCHGHTHIAVSQIIGPTRLLNPGALHRANPHSVAIVDLPEMKIEILPVS